MSNQSKPTSTPTGPTKFRTLLVEEDSEIARSVLTALNSAGVLCHHCPEVAGAMDALKKIDPHIALLSLGLPQIGGAVLCAPIRKISTVPIAILSLRTRREDHLHALNLGADEFITIRQMDEQMMTARILTLLRRVYRYDRQHAKERLDTASVQTPLSQLPAGWATCEACSYMGPQWRFEKVDAQGRKAAICPHCNEAQSLRFTVG